MKVFENLTKLAAAIGQETRAAILTRLLVEGEVTLGNLAKLENLTISTIREHIAALENAGLVITRKEKRWRIARLANQETKDLVRLLFQTANEGLSPEDAYDEIRAKLPECQKTYDYLTGRMGYVMFSSIATRGLLTSNSNRAGFTDAGRNFLTEFGIDVDALESARRPVVQLHRDPDTNFAYYGGGLGKAVLQRMIELGWFKELDEEPKLVFNEAHRKDFDAAFPPSDRKPEDLTDLKV